MNCADRRTRRLDRVDEALHLGERTLSDLLALELLVLHSYREIIDETEVRVHRLEMLRIRLAQIPIQRTEHRRRRRNERFVSHQETGEIQSREQAGGRAFSVAFDAGELTGEERRRIAAQRQMSAKWGGRVDIRVTVNRSVTKEFSNRK